jgi:hypothetical protein
VSIPQIHLSLLTPSLISLSSSSSFNFKGGAIDAATTTDSYLLYDSISAVNVATLSYKLPDDSGYYSYTLYVDGNGTKKTASQDDLKTAEDSAYDSVTAPDLQLQ